MKQGIHPTYEEAQVICSCGNTWTTRSTKKVLRTDLCSQCHPYFTGEQRIVDTAGQVDRFMRRMERAASEPRRSRRVERANQRRARYASTPEEEALAIGGEEAAEEATTPEEQQPTS
jgi:large subunit ribosomal protein L31